MQKSTRLWFIFAAVLVVLMLATPVALYAFTPTPVIVLNGEHSQTIEAGDEYVDPGFTATRGDNDVSDQVIVTGGVDTSKTGTYDIRYSIKPKLLLRGCEATRTVTIADTKAPKLTLKGEKTLVLYSGETYKEEGCTAVDAFDGDITSKVAVSGKVDWTKPGAYSLTYKATDSSGNVAEKKRSVTIISPDVPKGTPQNKIIYLTFDDGPSVNTEKLLKVLANEKVKATFFVTGLNKNYFDFIKKEADAGHTIALHTWSHNYAKLYKSDEAYYKDLKKIDKLVKEQTGIESPIIRFPGGGSNTVSRNYSKGIMTRLAKSTKEKGYVYYDWNALSMDATLPQPNAKKQAQYAIQGIKNRSKENKEPIIVLQHDGRGNKYAASATKTIIEWGRKNGYYFAPLNPSVPVVQQKVAN